MKQLLVNMIQCPDGTILESRYRHNFVEHIQDDGRRYYIDGGLSYNHVGYSDEKYKDLSCYVGDAHNIIRERFTWGSYGRDGDEPLHYIKLKDLTDEHLDNLIVYTAEVHTYPRRINDLFINEKYFRAVEGNLELGGDSISKEF